MRASKSPEGQFSKPYRAYQLALPKTYVTRRGEEETGRVGERGEGDGRRERGWGEKGGDGTKGGRGKGRERRRGGGEWRRGAVLVEYI